MPFGDLIKRLRNERSMTLRQLAEAAGMDYVILNKIENGKRMPPPLEAIIALADALGAVRPLQEGDFEQLLDLATEKTEDAGARFQPEEVQRLKESPTARVFFTRRVQDKES